MHSPLVSRLDTQAAWRSSLDRQVAAYARFLADHDLGAAGDDARLEALRHRLLADRLMLAFVAEFSRGKSELINAIFFADTGRRVLPATPGRTTMCPVELFHDAEEPPTLSLLPIETRLGGLSLAELRGRTEPWQRMPLDPSQPEALARALSAVTLTQRVPVEMAQRLGFWHPEQGADNPPQDAEGLVEVPAWRHALINYPHPLLQRGLVVIDTPGLNAIGAEPELTLSLLPAAHATVFILAADAGVTKSDLSVWREHLGGSAVERFVVLNKIDALADPLLAAEDVQTQIDRQRQQTAETLGLEPGRVFPLSAREALAARVAGDEAALRRSRLPELEAALAGELLPRQAELLAQATVETLREMREAAARRLGDRRRQNAEQMLELRGLRGKSGAKVRLMLERVETESAEFERCTARLQAMRVVQARLQREALAGLSSEQLRTEVSAMQSAAGASGFAISARKPFELLFQRLRGAIDAAQAKAGEMQHMLDGSFGQLNSEFGFAFTVGMAPDLARYRAELDLIAQNYGRYVGFSQAWRLAVPGFVEQFRRMLLSKLRVVFENAAGDIEMWSKSAGVQVEQQLRERRKAFQRRREALERIQAAAGELEQRIGEVEAQDVHLRDLQQRLDRLTSETVSIALGLLAPADAA
ncbi:dynamin family protein [Rubrivivax albus]|uniref:Dynamin family protein n=1 Tax=Rubrivivax albus TaxID=2499835 RepID=A0A437JZQ7_9BURK|nr:dynamin family protein [Rubrivivax albus]RVT53545.1 dynamin family protein [Rubrivivax albus]